MDDLTTQQPEVTEGAAKPSGFKAFYATTLGKIVVIGGAVVVFLTVLGIVAVLVIGFLGVRLGQQAVEQAIQQGTTTVTTGTVSTSGGKTAEAEEGTVTPVAVPNSEVYTFRDIFEPLASLNEPSSTETGTAGGEKGDGTFGGEANTLYLRDIAVENGSPVAVLWWNGTTYSLGVGGTIADTPWQVEEIRSSSVVMLYGDQRVTLYIGQGSGTN